MSTPIQIIVGDWPGCWPGTPQEFVTKLVITGLLNQNFPGLYIGPAEPPAQYRDRLWVKTTSGWAYLYINGNWVRPHPELPGTAFRKLWCDTETALWSEDGGDGTDPRILLPDGSNNPAYVAPSDAGGAMWMVDHAFDGRFAVGPGTIPDTGLTVPPTITQGQSRDSLGKIGEYTHTLLVTELPSHTHPLIGNMSDPTNREQEVVVPVANANPGFTDLPAATGATGGDPNTTPANQTVAHQNMPPYLAAFYAKRTARKYILAASDP